MKATGPLMEEHRYILIAAVDGLSRKSARIPLLASHVVLELKYNAAVSVRQESAHA